MLRLHQNTQSHSGARTILRVGMVFASLSFASPILFLTGGCEEYTVAPAPPPPPPPKDPSDPDGDGFKKKSVLGKAKESAENRIDEMNEYQKKVGDFADELFDQKRTPTQKPVPKPTER